MGPWAAFLHVLNFFLPAVLLGGVAALLAKLLWRQDLAGNGWLRLAAPAAGVGALVSLAGLLITGRDGRMATYMTMVLACALTLWWQGFGPGRVRR